MALTSQNAWSAYAKEILAQATSGQFDPKNQTFSLAGQTLNVDLANADSDIINACVFAIGNTIPADGGAYTPSSNLISSYFSFLNWIKLQGDPNPNLQSQINLAAAAIQPAQDNYSSVQTKAIAAWAAYKTALDPNISFLDYARTQYPTYVQAKVALDAAQSKYNQLMQQAYGADYSNPKSFSKE